MSAVVLKTNFSAGAFWRANLMANDCSSFMGILFVPASDAKEQRLSDRRVGADQKIDALFTHRVVGEGDGVP